MFKYIFGLKVVSKCDYAEVLKERCIIASNHMSNFDPPLIGSTMPIAIHFLAKEELFKFKPLGWIIRKFNATPVRRGVVDKKAISNVNDILNRDETIVIFPEGSRKSFTAKPGIGLLAINTKCNILPIYLENSNHLWQCLFRIKRLKIYIGQALDKDYYENMEANKDNYRALSKDILEKINGLKNGN
jgi:1-acyl-sn-glycerol-3-phosphate acyltransferase